MKKHEVDRRTYCLGGLAALSMGMSAGTMAQAQFTEGKDYKRLSAAVGGRTLPDGKRIEVLEFFWYGCPHCYAFEPALESWVKKLPGDVQLRRVPVGFGGVHMLHQKLYYALERLPSFPALHKKVFYAMHVDKRRMDTLSAVMEWAKENGVHEESLMADLKSVGVDSAARQARTVMEAYGVDSVPSLGIQGKYVTSPHMTGSYERTFAVVEAMLIRERG
jgi:thiol:disulfide interchange protein DsbA